MKNDFAKHVTGFFSNYLSAERGVSPNTMRSYGASFASFLDFMKEKKGTTAERLTLDHMNRKNVLEFLDWIQSGGCSVSTRNQRLAALHAFCKYMQYEDVGRLQQWLEVMSIKIKKTIKGTMNYLTLDGMKHLLSVIPTNTRRGRRNLALLSTLYETGARVQELIGLRPVDISLNQPCHGSPDKLGGRRFDSIENLYLCAMNNQGLLALAQLILPSEILSNFEVVRVEEESSLIRIYLDESVKADYKENPEIESKGFCEAVTIRDFPIRDKGVDLIVRRRKWYDKQNNRYFSDSYDLKAEGTRYSKEFAAFLKGVYGDDSYDLPFA